MSRLSLRTNKHGKGQCDRCGFIYPLKTLRYEWTGYKVCGNCWDPLPHQDFPDQIEAESTALNDPRPRSNVPADNGLVIGDGEIIGRNFVGADLGITGTGATVQ